MGNAAHGKPSHAVGLAMSYQAKPLESPHVSNQSKQCPTCSKKYIQYWHRGVLFELFDSPALHALQLWLSIGIHNTSKNAVLEISVGKVSRSI